MFGDNLRFLRKKAKLTQRQLAEKLKLAESTIGMYERNERQPAFETLEEIADLFNVDMNFLHGYVLDERIITGTNFDFINLPTQKIPIIGTVACGEPILAEENIIGYMDPIEFVNADYCLIAKGDSMINADIEDGDIIFIKQTNQVDNGQIAVVLIGDEATLKRFRRTKDTVMLIAENNEIDPIILSPEEEARIIGLATHITKVLR